MNKRSYPSETRLNANHTIRPLSRWVVIPIVGPQGPSWILSAIVTASLSMIAIGVGQAMNSRQHRSNNVTNDETYPVRITLWFGPARSNGTDDRLFTARSSPQKSALTPENPTKGPGDSILPKTASDGLAGEKPGRPAPGVTKSQLDPAAPFLRGLNFSIAETSSDKYATQARKKISIDGIDSGLVGITVSDLGTIRVDMADLVAVIPDKETDKVQRSSKDDKEVSFNELRDAGFEIRYDPIKDRIVMSTTQH